MPRSRQAFPRNAVMNHNPMQRMLFDPTAIAKMGPEVMQVPDILETVESVLSGWTNLITEVPALFEEVINAILAAIDTATGLDLTGVGSILDDILTWIDQAGAAFQTDWLNFQQLINAIVGEVDADVNDLITALTDTSTSVVELEGNWTTVLDELGLEDIPGLALFLADIQSWINQVGAALQAGWLNFQQLINGITGEVDADVTSLIAALTASGVAFTTLLSSSWTAVEDYTSWSTFLTAIETAWGTYVTTISDLTSGEFATIQQILDTLLGIDPTTGSTKVALYAASTFAVENVYPSPAGRGVLAANAKSIKAFVTVGLTGRGSVLPRPGSSDVQTWETFNSIIGVVTHIYPDSFSQGVLHASAVNKNFTFGVGMSGRGVLSAVVQEWQTFQSIIGVVQHVYPTLSNHGVLSATAVSIEFKFPVALSGRGALHGTVQDVQIFLGTIYGLNPPLTGRGVLKAVAASIQFKLSATLSSRGALAATVQDFFVPGPTVTYGLYPTLPGHGVLSGNVKSDEFKFPVALSGRGVLAPIIQDWQTFNSIIGRVEYVYPSLTGRGVLKATAASIKFTLPAVLTGRGVLQNTVQSVQVLVAPIYGLNPSPSGRGVLKAVAASIQFKLPGVLSSHGALVGVVSQTGIISVSGTVYTPTVYPTLHSLSSLKATAASIQFKLPAVLSGRGVFAGTIQDWQTFYSIIGVVNHIYIVLSGHGSLSATVSVKQFSLSGQLHGQGVLSVKVPDVTSASFVLGNVEHVYSFLTGQGVLKAIASSKQFRLPVVISGRGALTNTALPIMGLGGIFQLFLNGLWDLFTGNPTGSYTQVVQAITDLLQLLGLSPTSALGTGSPAAPAVSSIPLIGTLVPATNSTVANDIFGGSTFWTSLMSLLFPAAGGSVGSAVDSGAVNNVLGNASLGDDLTAMATALFGAPAVASLTTVENDIANFISNAISGGSAPTNPSSPVAFLENLLGINGIPHTNVAIPPNPGTGTVTHDANFSPTPFNGTPTAIETLNWTHSNGTNANYLLVRLAYYAFLPSIATVGVVLGSQMQLLASVIAPDNKTYVQIFGLANPPVGSVTLSATVSSPFGSAIQAVIVQSSSYNSVGAVQTTNTNSGNGTSPSMNISSASGDYIVQAFGVESNISVETLSSYTATGGGTVQYNSGDVPFSTSSHMTLLGGDAPGSSSVNFTATANAPVSTEWGAAAVNFTALSSATLGSGYTGANTNTAASSASSGNNLFTNNFFNVNNYTSDYSYNTTGNVLTVSQAGWYKVVLHVLEASTFTTHYVRPVLYHQGAVTMQGPVLLVNTTASNTYTFGMSWNIYCSAGDTLQPGYWVNTAVTSIFVGESTGQFSYWNVTLANRSLF